MASESELYRGVSCFFCWLPAAGPIIDSAGRVVDSAHNQRSMQDRRPSEILHKSGSNGVRWVSEPVGPLEVLRQWYDWRWFLCCAAGEVGQTGEWWEVGELRWRAG